MGHYKGCTPKRHWAYCNSRVIHRLDKGVKGHQNRWWLLSTTSIVRARRGTREQPNWRAPRPLTSYDQNSLKFPLCFWILFSNVNFFHPEILIHHHCNCVTTIVSTSYVLSYCMIRYDIIRIWSISILDSFWIRPISYSAPCCPGSIPFHLQGSSQTCSKTSRRRVRGSLQPLRWFLQRSLHIRNWNVLTHRCGNMPG